ncbi:MAG: glycoside hydrolase family 127 protein, partial [Clostridiales bacterium]|nr:glycoside hydrolase family 127 protein [Clostridiales bacterium]
MKKQKQISVSAYRATGFIGKYQKLVGETVIPYQHSVLYDMAPDTEKSHVAANFANAAKALKGEDVGDGFYGMVFQDSDAAKWIEAVAYSLVNRPDEEMERKADELIDLVAAAQDEDGYLNTYFTIKDRDKRWTNLFEAHELYCAGHFIEAACAYYEATGKRKLLDVMLKNTEHIYRRFVTGGAEGEPGHPEIELALMKLYRLTKNEHALELCKRFINKRGQDPEVFVRESEKRSWSVWNSNPRDLEYRQADMPVRDQKDAKGHAVRAVYLYTGMADLASETGDKELFAACRRLWESIVKRRMYLTGGIGSTVHGEAFTVDYDLPSDTAYCETCASVGLVFFASRMLENEVRGEYADVMELAFYNTVLAGMQLDGKRFFYVNPLQVDPGISGVSPTRRHDLPVRPKWYACACCPPNAARLIGSFGMYAYGESFGTNDSNESVTGASKTAGGTDTENAFSTVYCHMYAAGDVEFSCGMKLHCETDYPYDMNVRYKITGSGRLAIRIPAWSRTFGYALNGAESSIQPVNGYIYVNVHDGDEVSLKFDGKPSYIRASTRIPNLAGMTAVKRGPLVYCFEGVDNGNVKALRLKKDTDPEIGAVKEELGAV